MKMSLGSSDQQRRLPLVIDNTDPRVMVQQPIDDMQPTCPRCIVQRHPTVAVTQVRIGSAINQNLYR